MISTTSRRELVRVVHMPTGIEHISERMGDKDSLKRAGERAKAIVASKVWWAEHSPPQNDDQLVRGYTCEKDGGLA